MARMQLLVLAVIVAATVQIAWSDESATKTKLLKDKAVNYNAAVDPGEGTTVRAGVSFVCAKLDTTTNQLKTRVFEYYAWTDYRLVWKPTDYDGLQRISVPASLTWSPDIKLINAFPIAEVKDDVNAIHLSNGTVYWIPPTTYHSLCSPSEDEHDHSHHCHLSLGPWSYNTPSLSLALFDAGFDTRMYLKECPFVIKNAKAVVVHKKYECCDEPFDRIEINFDVVENDHHDDDHHDDDDDEHDKKDQSECRWPHC